MSLSDKTVSLLILVWHFKYKTIMKIIINPVQDIMPGPQGKQSQWVKNLFPAFPYAHIKMILIFKFCDYKSFNIFIIRKEILHLFQSWVFFLSQLMVFI